MLAALFELVWIIFSNIIGLTFLLLWEFIKIIPIWVWIILVIIAVIVIIKYNS